MSSFEAQVKLLSATDVYTIQTQYDAVMDTEHGSGEHWLLIAALNQKGFGLIQLSKRWRPQKRSLFWAHPKRLSKREKPMGYQPKAGDIIKMHSWHGVVLNVFTSDTGQTVLQVQTARNVFRGYPPEFIELNLAPEVVTSASRADLEKEIRHLQQMRELGLKQMLERIDQPVLMPERESSTPAG